MVRSADIKVPEVFFDRLKKPDRLEPDALTALVSSPELLNTGIGPVHSYEAAQIASGTEADAATG